MGKARYWFWLPNLDIVPSGLGAYAANEEVPDIDVVIKGGVFCQEVVNLIRRVNRKTVPTRGDERYDGYKGRDQNEQRRS